MPAVSLSWANAECSGNPTHKQLHRFWPHVREADHSVAAKPLLEFKGEKSPTGLCGPEFHPWASHIGEGKYYYYSRDGGIIIFLAKCPMPAPTN